MFRTAVRTLRVLFLILVLFKPIGSYARNEPGLRPQQESDYGAKFFDQLRSLFGRFRDADLQRAFQTAAPIPCSELVEDRGEWREVAFFNDNRKLGDWYHSSLEEVRTDLAVYIFSGPCRGEHGPVQLTTKFPVTESIDAYNEGKINFKQIAVNVNAPVSAIFDSRTQAYTFELPYMFLVSRQDGDGIYSLNPRSLTDRNKFDPDVTDHWDCKAVRGADVTYQFLICRTTLSGRDDAASRNRNTAFGSSAYFILSDGKEAFSSVKLSFGDTETPPAPNSTPPQPEASDRRPPQTIPETPPPGAVWQLPDFRLAVVDVGEGEFRIIFNPETWKGKIRSSQVLSGQGMSSLESARPQEGADYCVWFPGFSNLMDRLLTEAPDEYVSYSVKAVNKDRTTSASIVFDMKTHNGVHLGTLQCFFPRRDSPASIGFDRWSSIVGDHLTLEVNR
jgi:hypothetical protein